MCKIYIIINKLYLLKITLEEDQQFNFVEAIVDLEIPVLVGDFRSCDH